MNIIGDVAGQYDALMRLIDKMPKDEILLVGDLVDRGPKSKEVVEWAKSTPGVRVIRGNHEDLMNDHLFDLGNYPRDCWIWNGGQHTIDSYSVKDVDGTVIGPTDLVLMSNHGRWLNQQPLFYESDDLLVTHAPIARYFENWKDCLKDDGAFEHGGYVLWNRGMPCRREKFQVFGHNSMWGLCWMVDGVMTRLKVEDELKPRAERKFASTKPEKAWGVCLDNSRSKVLTGMHWPSCEIFQESFGDPYYD